MSNDETTGADSQPLPPTRLDPPAGGAVASAGNRHVFRDAGGKWAKRPQPVVEQTPWHDRPPTLAGEDIARAAEDDDWIEDLRATMERRRKRQRLVRNACIALIIFIVVYMAAQFLRLAI